MLDEIQIQQASFTENALNSANIRMAFSDFPLKQFLRKDLILNGTHHVWVTLEKPVYGNATTFDFIFNKGNIALRQKGESLIQFDDVQLNQQKLGYIEIHADLTKPQNWPLLTFDRYAPRIALPYLNLIAIYKKRG